ncbi:MAG: alpha/beta fold hydrolase [Dehalococcoidales bacterium]|nr:MAG: alpha/beta fold hydrolase [Dehalococcoidales bacterium]
MPYAKNGDINIYYEVEGEGPPLVMLQGLTGSLEGWKESGYVDALKDDYQLILMDARGRGKSDKPHDPAMYTGQNLVGDIIAVLDDVGIESANCFGYSYGGGFALECAKYAPDRMKSLIVGGAGARLPPPEMLEEQIKLFETLASAPEQVVEVPPDRKARLLANDCEALVAICKAMLSSPPLIDDLPGMHMAFLIFVGESDFAFSGAKETSELLPDATFVSFPGLDHIQAGSRLDLVIPHIKEFLSKVN